MKRTHIIIDDDEENNNCSSSCQVFAESKKHAKKKPTIMSGNNLEEDVPRLLTSELLAELKTKGAVVIPGVLSEQACKEIYEAMVEYHIKWNPALASWDPKDWTIKNRPPGVHGLNQFDGQQQFCWDVRQNPRVVQVFAELFNVSPSELLTSMDGFRFLIKGKNYKRGTWGHTDQGNHMYDDEFVCVQASVAITDSTDPRDGDFVFWSGGHKAHRGYFEQNPDCLKGQKTNWYKYPEEYLRQIEIDGSKYLQAADRNLNGAPTPMERIRVKRRPGDMVLWYSKTPHQSDPPAFDAPHDAAVVFVCMAPRKYATPKELKRRIEAFEQGRTTTHWPIRGFKMFGKEPRMYGSDQHEDFRKGKEGVGTPIPNLTPLGRRLVGYEK